ARLCRTDPFAFEIFRFSDGWRADENVVHLVHCACDHGQIRAARASADDGLTRHTHDGKIAGDERLRAARASFDENEIRIRAETFEQSFFFCNPDWRLISTEGRISHEKLLL